MFICCVILSGLRLYSPNIFVVFTLLPPFLMALSRAKARFAVALIVLFAFFLLVLYFLCYFFFSVVFSSCSIVLALL